MDEIIDLILSKYKLTKHDETKQFLEALKNGNDYQQRLLICLGIDSLVELVDIDVMSSIFNCLDYTKCISCDELIEEYENAILKNDKFVGRETIDPLSENITLARVMKASTFSNHFYPKIDGIYDVNPNWKDLKNEIERGNLENINLPNNAQKPRGLVWCTPLDDLENIIDECIHKSMNPADEIVDRLGLYASNSSNNDYLYFKYEKLFNQPIFRTCNLSNSWLDSSSLFISSTEPGIFGRTRPRTGDNASRQMKEAVHMSIDDSSLFCCDIIYLGTMNNFTIETTNFNQEALKRYRI